MARPGTTNPATKPQPTATNTLMVITRLRVEPQVRRRHVIGRDFLRTFCGKGKGSKMRSIPVMTLLTLVAASGVFAQDQQPSLDELIAIVNGKDSIKSAEAVAAIGRRKATSDSAVQTLIDALADDRRAEYVSAYLLVNLPVETVGSTASDALAEVGKPAVLPICEYLRNQGGKNARKLAVRSLAKMEADAGEALPTLQRLLNDPEMEIRLETVAAIVSIQTDPRALSSTLGSVLSDQSPDVRAAAIRALGDLGEAGSPNVPRLLKLLDDREDRWHFFTPDMAGTLPVRYDCAMALAEMGDDGRVALTRLRELMNGDSEALVRVAAAYAIAKLDDASSDALDHLVESIEDRENGWRVPEAAVKALGKLRPKAKAALSALTGALEHPETMVRMQAIEAIAVIAPESAERRLLPMLRDKDALVRVSAIEALGAVPNPSPRLLNSYIAALDDNESLFCGEDVRHAAAVAHGQLQDKATPALARLNRLIEEEESQWVKQAAAKAVRQIEQGRSKKSEGTRITPTPGR